MDVGVFFASQLKFVEKDTGPADRLTLSFTVLLLAWIKSEVFISRLFVNV